MTPRDNESVSLERFELLELRRDGEIQTYHAREIATARPVQVHLFSRGNTAENAALLGLIGQLPETERRRVIDRGESHGIPYLVTDRLAGYADVREWITTNAAAAPIPHVTRPATVDEQFFALFDSATAAPTPSAVPPVAKVEPAPPPKFESPAPKFESAPAPWLEAAPAPDPEPGPAIPGPAHYTSGVSNSHASFPAFAAHSPMTREVENPSLLSGSIEIEALQPQREFLPTAAKSVLWLILGVMAALAFLAAVAAFFFFRPH